MMSNVMRFVVVVLLWLCGCAVVDARPGAYEYQLMMQLPGRVVNMPSAPSPICYSFDGSGHSTRALTRYDGLAWHIQVDSRFASVVSCDGYEWARVDARFDVIVLDPARLRSVLVYEDVDRMPHSVDATVCRQMARTGVSYCYAPVVSIEVDTDGARWWVNVTESWYMVGVRVDDVDYDEYELLTRTPDGRVIVDPNGPEEFTPLCYSFSGVGRGVMTTVYWEQESMSWRIRIDKRYAFALTCIGRAWGIIEDADRGMPGAVLILDTAPMQTLQIHRDTDAQPVEVRATACLTTQYAGTFCYSAEVWVETTTAGVVEWYTNINDGWALTVTTSQPAMGGW